MRSEISNLRFQISNLQGRDPKITRCGSRVKSALGFLPPRPSACAVVFAFADGARAVSAADARIAAKVKRIEWHIIALQIIPHVALRPSDGRIDLDESPSLIPFDRLRRRASRSLIAPDRRHPGRESVESFFQRLKLSDLAAKVCIALPEASAEKSSASSEANAVLLR